MLLIGSKLSHRSEPIRNLPFIFHDFIARIKMLRIDCRRQTSVVSLTHAVELFIFLLHFLFFTYNYCLGNGALSMCKISSIAFTTAQPIFYFWYLFSDITSRHFTVNFSILVQSLICIVAWFFQPIKLVGDFFGYRMI